MRPEIYLIWHDTGWPGSWLSWFINQHKNFPKTEGSYMYNRSGEEIESMAIGSHRPNPLHFSCFPLWNASFLKNVDPRGYIPSNEYMEIDEFIKFDKPWQAHNKQFSKIILKLFRNHSPSDIGSLIDNIDNINKEITVKKNITLISGSANKLIADRLRDLEPTQTLPSVYWKVDHIDKLNISKFFPKMDAIAPTHIVNIGNLLNYDYEEYNKLLMAIDEEPLDNWKELVDVIKEVFNKYK